MDELSMHILDVVQNSIKANASIVEIVIEENKYKDIFQIQIKDNGEGMNEETLQKVCDPFFTTRTTRQVGMGLSLFKMACEQTNGVFHVESIENMGTTINASFTYHHIDRAPLGNIVDTLMILILNDKNVDIYYKHIIEEHSFIFDTKEIKKILGDTPIQDNTVILWLKNYLQDGLSNIY
jgi:hypothetical protein